MWARRLSGWCVRRMATPGGRPPHPAGLHSDPRMSGRHAAVSAGWKSCGEAARLPGGRTCSLGSRRCYSAELTADGVERTPDEALPDFNINVLVNLLRQENGKDLCVIKVPPEMKYVDYFVVVGGTSARHLQAMARYTLKVYKFLKGENEQHVCLEGKDTDDWMCIDFGNIVVHFMLPETRETYELEKLWTLRSYDDQLSQMSQEVLPPDFTFGLHEE